MSTHTDGEPDNESDNIEVKDSVLILWDDAINTIEDIISNLVNICGHSSVQAEQCATIADYNGKTDIKSGDYDDLLDLKMKFDSKKINTSIQK
jgi:ATP-dependent Clp protease adaptor protein ClpS